MLASLDRVLERALALLLFAMMAITAVDVIGRYLFSAPIYGGYEIVQFMMALMVFCSLPITTRHEGHLSVSLLAGRLRGRAARAHRVIVLLVSLAGVIVIAWRVSVQGGILAGSKQISGLLEWPLAPIAYAMAVFAWIAVVALVGLLIHALRGGTPAAARTSLGMD